MPAEVTNVNDGMATVVVYDRRMNKHIVQVFLDDGSIGKHGQDAYPHGSENKTETQRRLMVEAERRARYQVHSETEYDVLDPGWDPDTLERGVEAFERLPRTEFAEQFENYHRALADPETVASQESYGVTENLADGSDTQVVLVRTGFCVDDTDRVTGVDSNVFIYYGRPDGENEYPTDHPTACPGGETPVPLSLLPFDLADEHLAFPGEFEMFLQNNLRCQVRDLYRRMGEDPSRKYDVEGLGKIEHVDEPWVSSGLR